MSVRPLRWLCLLLLPGLLGCSLFGGDAAGEDLVPLQFEGLTVLDPDTLREAARRELRTFLSSGGTDADGADAAFAMEQLLIDAGHALARVDFEVLPPENDGEAPGLRLRVAEGPRFTLAAPTLRYGALDALPDELARRPARVARPEMLDKLLTDQEAKIEAEHALIASYFALPAGLFTGADDTFRADIVSNGAEQTRVHYLLGGFEQVAVTAALEPDLEDPRVRARLEDRTAEETIPVAVRVTIDSGPRTVIRTVRAPEASEDDEEATRAVAQAQKDLGQRPWHLRQLGQAEASAQRIFAEAGRPSARVKAVEGNRLTLENGDQEVEILLTLFPGPRVIIDEITVTGLDRTKEWFVRSLLDLRPGDLATATRIEDSIDRLYRTGLFDLVRLRSELRSEAPAEAAEPAIEGTEEEANEAAIDAALEAAVEEEVATTTPLEDQPALLEVRLAEVEARSFDTEVGWGSYELARVGLRYRDRNIFGIGRELDTRTWFSLKSYGLLTRVLDPWTLGDDDDLEVAAGIDFRQRPSYDSTRLTFDAKWRHRFQRNLWVDTGYRFTADQAEATAEDAMLPDEDGFVVTAGIFSQLHWDRRDDPLLPSRGDLLEVGFFLSRPEFLAELNFIEVSGSYAWHHPLAVDQVLAVGTRFVTRHLLGDEESLPIQERLFLGGANSVRSFEEDFLGPADEDGEPLGGRTTLVATVEYRRQIAGVLWGAAFVDVGMVGRESFDFLDHLGYAVGLGLRAHLPIGPIRLDFGYNPGNSYGQGDQWALHFGFGFSF